MLTQTLIALSVLAVQLTVPLWARGAEPPASQPSIPIWPEGKMPGHGATGPEHLQPEKPDQIKRLTDVSTPTLTIYPANVSAPCPAVVISPGGGYSILAIDKEGTEIAQWLNTLGITAFVLKYRVPNNRDGAFDDIQRAVRVVRQNAGDWKIDPHKLGVMGFSAGGHLSARLTTNFKTPAYPPIDAIDQLSCRPDFTVLVYPAYLNKGDAVAPELPISPDLPPILIVHNEDDKTYVPGSKLFDAALTAQHVPHHFDFYPTGGHGYGLQCKKDAKAWPVHCAAWLAEQGVIPPQK